ncbi:GntR family transcriptional regulator [Microbacterium esteraromaticum]|nr:GntR family transcriptional regulator [Microbacterium esteraromaticum]
MSTSLHDHSTRSSVRRETVAEQSAEILRAQMLTGQLKPGDAVTEEAMAREIGISRPTMREVLSTLLAEGLLTRSPSTRVLHVTSITAQEIREIYVVRRLLESAGVDAMADASPSDLARLEAATARLIASVEVADRPAVVLADIECHLATVTMIGAPDLVDFYRRQLTKLEVAMSEGMRTPSDLDEALESHSTFLELVRSGKLIEAKAQLLARLDEAEALQLSSLEK